MLELHLDPLGGISGDMFVAALLDLRPDLQEGLQGALKLCPLIERVECELIAHHDGVLTGSRFIVRHPDHGADHSHDQEGHHHGHAGQHDDGPHGHHQHAHAPGHAHPGHGHAADAHHDHVAWRDIREALSRSALDGETIRHALGIFRRLAEAEARVHGTQPDDVAFHEVGAWDSIADIVSAGWLVARLQPLRWTAGVIPLGSGRVRTAHGLLPVPAPATVHLLEGFATIDDGIAGERVTPTGAAILSYLCSEGMTERRSRRLTAAAHGFGSKRLPGVSNCLRVLAFEAAAGASTAASEDIAVLECEIDDQTSEDIAQAVERLRAAPGVRDVVQAPVFGKKGRMMTHLRVLAVPSASADVAALLFDETTTIGVRRSIVERLALRREPDSVAHEGKAYPFKVVDRPSGRTVKLEADALADIAGAGRRHTVRRLIEGLLRQKRGDIS